MGPENSFRFSFVRNILLTIAGVCLVGTAAWANDGGIAFGGNPTLLHGHPSVIMTNEVIRIDVRDKYITVDCDFVFTNSGRACTVRMGFPDEGEGASDPDEDDGERGEDVMSLPPKTTFKSFRSYVDGKPVTTRLIRADKEGHFWHTKTVQFAAHSTCHIRDVYTQSLGGGIAMLGNKSCWVDQIGYIVHTGASWHGDIGRTEIDVTFHCKRIDGTPIPVSSNRAGIVDRDVRLLKAESVAPNTVVWYGLCEPTVHEKTLQFVRRNWHPTAKDDLLLTYGYTALPK